MRKKFSREFARNASVRGIPILSRIGRVPGSLGSLQVRGRAALYRRTELDLRGEHRKLRETFFVQLALNITGCFFR